MKKMKGQGYTSDEARKMLGIGINLMLKLVKVEGFPAVRFKRNVTKLKKRENE